MPDDLAVRFIVTVTSRAAAEQFLFGQELLVNLEPAFKTYVLIKFICSVQSQSSAFRQKIQPGK